MTARWQAVLGLNEATVTDGGAQEQRTESGVQGWCRARTGLRTGGGAGAYVSSQGS